MGNKTYKSFFTRLPSLTPVRALITLMVDIKAIFEFVGDNPPAACTRVVSKPVDFTPSEIIIAIFSVFPVLES